MISQKLSDFIKDEHKRLLNFYKYCDAKQFKYPAMIKLTEEVGELAQEILRSENCQRLEKLDKNHEIGSEIADVIITTLLVAENNGIDINSELKKAIKKCQSRSY